MTSCRLTYHNTKNDTILFGLHILHTHIVHLHLLKDKIESAYYYSFDYYVQKALTEMAVVEHEIRQSV